jgi:hypothetical protein
MTATIINFTPHDLTIIKDGKTSTIPSSGSARLISKPAVESDFIIYDGITLPLLSEPAPVRCDGLPDQQLGIMIVVSRVVAEFFRGRRSDLLVVNAVRDENGRTIGTDGFTRLITSGE